MRRVIFAVEEGELAEGEDPLSLVLERQMSYFADEDGFNGLLKHLGDNPWCEVYRILLGGFDKTNPLKPFSLWKNVDADFKDPIAGLTNFDPAKRLTVREALGHKWFGGI